MVNEEFSFIITRESEIAFGEFVADIIPVTTNLVLVISFNPQAEADLASQETLVDKTQGRILIIGFGEGHLVELCLPQLAVGPGDEISRSH